MASEQKDAAADEVVDSDSEEQSCKYNVIGSIRPVNVEAEKSKFFKLKFDYNPTFKYYNPLPPEVLQKYSNASDLYLPQVRTQLSINSIFMLFHHATMLILRKQVFEIYTGTMCHLIVMVHRKIRLQMVSLLKSDIRRIIA